MRRFRFTLATVLSVKKRMEEVRQRELALAKLQRDQVMAHLAVLLQKVQDQAGAHSDRRRGRLNLALETWYQASFMGLKASIGRARLDLQDRETEFETARLKAVEASRERAALEKLEEQQFQDHQFRLNREEQGFLDELALRAAGPFGAAEAKNL